MAGSPYLGDLETHVVANTISASHFGVNYVTSVNSFGAGSDYASIIQHLGASAIRYPGGTVTEQYLNPGSAVWRDLYQRGWDETRAADGKIIEGPGRLFEYAHTHDLGVQFVLPTMDLVRTQNGRIVVDQAAVGQVKALVSDVLAGRFGAVDIDHFEIGNEYYFYSDLSAEEYGKVADALIKAVDGAIQDHARAANLPANWDAPKIAVQAGAGWQEGDNTTIINSLSQGALDAVDSVVVHYYAPSLEETDTRDRHLDQIQEWQDAVGPRPLDYFASEWNIYDAGAADTGMAQASALISGFETLLAAGVDSASIWGAQFRWLDAGLSSNFGGPDLSQTDARLSVAGEIIASMEESLIGLRAIDMANSDMITAAKTNGSNVAPSDDTFVVNSFGNEDRAVIYISSRSDRPLQLKLDPASYFGGYTHIWGETLTSIDDPATTWANESDPNTPHGLPEFDLLSENQLTNGNVTVPAHGILRVSVQLSNDGVTMNDHDPIFASDIDYDDEMTGSEFDDRMAAHVGRDVLTGRGGNDAIRGGADSDYVYGGTGDDALFGDDGNDRLFGGDGRDEVSGGYGNDYVQGGGGNDIVTGGEGNDRVFGGKGDDIVSGGRGNDALSGGDGADYFVSAAGAHGFITDFDSTEGDRITFLGQFDDPAALRAAMTSTGDGGDLIVTSETGTKTYILGAGGQEDAFVDSVVDFQDAGMAALDVSEALNDMSGADIRQLFEEMDSETFDATFAAADPIILFANLDAKVAGQVLDAMDPDDLDALFGDIGVEGLLIGLSEYTPDEVVTLFDHTSAASAQQIVGFTGEESAKSLLDGMDRDDRARLEPKLLGKTQQADQTNEVSLEDFPTVPLPAREEETDTRDAAEDDIAVAADCFVATVAYADGNHPEVWLLRWYRDTVLRHSILGRAFIMLYWWLGPRLAETVYGRPAAVRLFRNGISMLVRAIAWQYGRNPGRQVDQPVLTDSRMIRLRAK